MSRLRHRSSGHKKTHEKTMHHAAGGEAEVGNPSVFKLAKGHSIGKIHGEGSKSHLGEAKGGKIDAKHRAKGGGADQHPYSSAHAKGGKCHEKGGTVHHEGREHHPISHITVHHHSIKHPDVHGGGEKK